MHFPPHCIVYFFLQDVHYSVGTGAVVSKEDSIVNISNENKNERLSTRCKSIQLLVIDDTVSNITHLATPTLDQESDFR